LYRVPSHGIRDDSAVTAASELPGAEHTCRMLAGGFGVTLDTLHYYKFLNKRQAIIVPLRSRKVLVSNPGIQEGYPEDYQPLCSSKMILALEHQIDSDFSIS
jgi:hypothetical protein